MRMGGRASAAALAGVLVLLPLGCSSDDDGDDASTDTTSAAGAAGDTTTTAASAEATTTTEASASDEPAGGGTATLTATGAMSLQVSGTGFCAYYFPGEERGISYTISSLDNPGTGSWDFHVQGDDAASAGALLNTPETSYANDAALGNGTIDATEDPPNHVDFDLDLVNIVNHDQVVHVTGSIDC